VPVSRVGNAGDGWSGETGEQASDTDDVSERNDWNAGLDQTQLRMDETGVVCRKTSPTREYRAYGKGRWRCHELSALAWTALKNGSLMDPSGARLRLGLACWAAPASLREAGRLNSNAAPRLDLDAGGPKEPSGYAILVRALTHLGSLSHNGLPHCLGEPLLEHALGPSLNC
jgi:hypothetical protein